MRVRIINSEGRRLGEFFSLTEASQNLGIPYYRLKKYYTIERIHEQGYWADVPIDYLKMVSVRKYGYKAMRIE